MRSFVINLPGADGRLDAFRGRERSAGLESVAFPAVDGRSLESLPVHNPDLTAGEVGCFLSHRDLLAQVAAEGGREWIVVLEDDVHFWDGFADLLPKVVADADRMGKDVVQLGWVPLTKEPDRVALARDRLAAAPVVRRAARLARPRLRLEAPWVVDAPWGWGTHCYMVRRGFSGVVADLLSGPRIHAPVDHYFPLLRQLYRDRVGRARFSLAGQVPGSVSTVVEGRAARPFQTDSRGRVVRG